MGSLEEHSSAHNDHDMRDFKYHHGSGRNALRPRIRRAIRQFMKYSIVGASGFVINLAIYTLMVKAVGMHYIVAAIVSFSVAVTNNFILNKYWTFNNPSGAVSLQARRFLIVSIFSLGLNLVLLRALMEIFVNMGSLGALNVDAAIIAQAIAVTICTVINFSGNKLWSFRQATTP